MRARGKDGDKPKKTSEVYNYVCIFSFYSGSVSLNNNNSKMENLD